MSEKNDFYSIKNYPGAKTNSGVLYSDYSNGEFAYKMWEKQKEDANTLEDAMPFGIWADSVGLNNEDFNSAFEIAMGDNYEPTDRPIPEVWESSVDDKARMTFQGQTYGWGDEIQGAMGAVGDVITGNADEQSFSELYTSYRDSERARIKEFRTNKPIEALSYEIGGAFLSPAGIIKAPKLLKELAAAKKLSAKVKAGTKVVAASGTAGLIYGAGTTDEETTSEIAKDSLQMGVTTSLFGLGFHKVIPLVGKGKEKLFNLFKQTNNQSPSVAKLKELKNTAYDAVKTSFNVFDNKDFNAMYAAANKIAVEGHHTASKDTGVNAALNIFKALKANTGNYSLTQMDKVKQALSKLYSKNPEQNVLVDMMDIVDKQIATKAGSFPEIEAARIANTLFKKVEKLDQAFQKARRNKLADPNKSNVEMYKQSIANILNDPKAIKYFDPKEVQLMESFLKGGIAERAIQRAAGLKVSVQSLLTSLAFSTVFQNPLFMLSLGVGQVANKIAEPAIKRKAEQLIQQVGKIPSKGPTPGSTPVGMSGGMATNTDAYREQ